MSRFNQTTIRLCAAVFAVAILFSVPSFTLAATQSSNIKIGNFGRINDNYYRGAMPEGHDFADLHTLGIRTVIDLTNGDGDQNEKAEVERAGMTYHQIPMTTHVNPTEAQIAEFLGLVNDPSAQPVYVHCVGGKHRTGVMTAIYRMKQDSWTADQAFQEMKQFKFGMDMLHPEFKSFVFNFYTALAKSIKLPELPKPATAAAAVVSANP
jgi:protein tyrosine/serine phosphatase